MRARAGRKTRPCTLICTRWAAMEAVPSRETTMVNTSHAVEMTSCSPAAGSPRCRMALAASHRGFQDTRMVPTGRLRLTPARPRAMSHTSTTRARVREIAEAMAAPVTPSSGAPQCPWMSTNASVMLTTLAPIVTYIGVRASPAPRSTPLDIMSMASTGTAPSETDR